MAKQRSVAEKVEAGGLIVGALISIGFLVVLGVVFYGNLSGNVGFAEGTQGFNDSEAVIGNQTAGLLTFSNTATNLYSITSTILIIILISILFIVGISAMRRSQTVQNEFT